MQDVERFEYVHVLVDHDDYLVETGVGGHRLPGRHAFPRKPLVDTDQADAVRAARRVDRFQSGDKFPVAVVFGRARWTLGHVGRNAGEGIEEHRTAAVRDGRNVDKEIVPFHQAQIAVHFPVGALVFRLVQGDFAFDDHLGMGRHHDVVGFAPDELDGLASQPTCNFNFAFAETGHLGAAYGPHGGIYGNRNGHPACAISAPLHAHEQPPAVLTGFGVQSDLVFPLDLAAIGADIRPQPAVVHEYGARIDVTGGIGRIVLEPGKPEQVDIVSRQSNFLAGSMVRLDVNGLYLHPVPGLIDARHQLVARRPVHLLVVVADVLDTPRQSLDVPIAVEVGDNRAVAPLSVDFHALDQQGGRVFISVLVDQAIHDPRGLIPVLIDFLEAHQLAAGLDGVDEIAQGVVRTRESGIFLLIASN